MGKKVCEVWQTRLLGLILPASSPKPDKGSGNSSKQRAADLPGHREPVGDAPVAVGPGPPGGGGTSAQEKWAWLLPQAARPAGVRGWSDPHDLWPC